MALIERLYQSAANAGSMIVISGCKALNVSHKENTV